MNSKGKLFLVLLSLVVVSLVCLVAVNAATPWAPNTYYAVGAIVTYNGIDYQCIQAHTSLVGWEPPNVPALWGPIGTSATPTNTNTPSSVATPTNTNTNTPSSGSTPTNTNTNTPTTSSVATPTNTPTASSIGNHSNRVLCGYWETWDGIQVHPPVGHIPLNSSHTGFTEICVAFPILLADGTCVLEDGSAPGEDPPEPAEIAQAKAAGRKVLLSIGGAAAGIDLNSTSVADRFISTCIDVISYYGFDGIDIDIETGLVAGPNWSTLSPSQSNLIRIINGVTNNFGSGFLLTMAPETAYVTGGTIAYGGPWGAYLPVINAVKNKLSWLQMQYYNGSMYDKYGNGYPAGTIEGMVKQTEALIDGFVVAGSGGAIFSLPAEKVVIGLPAAPGAGGGYMSPSSVQSGFNTLKAKYPRLRGLMTWSVNWDASKGYEFVSNHRPYLDSLGNY